MTGVVLERGKRDSVMPMPTARQPTLLDLMCLSDWSRFVPETIGLLVAVALVRSMMGDSAAATASMPHPFWIPVLLMAAQYGIMGGLFAVLAAGCAYMATELPTQSASQDFYDYATVAAAQPCAWFAAALVLGGLRTLHNHHATELKEQLAATNAAAEDLAGRLGAALGEIGLLETRIATDTATTAALLEALTAMDLSTREAVLATAPAFIRLATGYGSVTFQPVQVGQGSASSQAWVSAQAQAGSISAALSIEHGPELLGWLVCTQLSDSQDAALAARRLHEVCRVLGKLVSACPHAASARARA